MHRYDEAGAILRQLLDETAEAGLDEDLEEELREFSVDLSPNENGSSL